MSPNKSWWLPVLLVSACAIPNVDIVDSLDGAGGSTAGGSTGQSGKTGQGGKTGNPGPTTDAGADSGIGGADETSPGGDSSGATGGVESPPSGGTSSMAGAAGTAGSGPMPLGAVGKFCNEITLNGLPVDLELRIGTGSSMVKIVAATGTCEPVVRRACTALPLGNQNLDVYEVGGGALWTGSMAKIQSGEAWIFAFYFDDVEQTALLDGSPALVLPGECATVDFSDLFPGVPGP